MAKILLLVILVLLPFAIGMSKFVLTILNLTMIHAVAAMGLNLIMGYTGQVSIGHAAFMSVGAYTSALLSMKLSLPVPLSITMAVVIAGVLGFALGFPSLRLTGFYLAITTMGFAVAIEQLFGAWKDLTGGHIGLRNIPKIGSELFNYYLMLFLVSLCLYIFYRTVNHKTGRALKAIRENPVVARVFGVNITKYKLLAFVVGSAFAGLSGALYAHEIGYIAPSDFGIGKSLELLAIVVVGGLATLAGPFFGSIVYTVLPFFFSRSGFSLSIVFGSILVGTVLFMPRGIAYYVQTFWVKYGELPLVVLKRRKKCKEGLYVKLSFGKIHYVDSNVGQKVILCIHGNFGSWRWFKPLMERIKDSRVIALDLPNFGDSSRAEASLEFYTEAVREFVEKLNLGRVTVIAHSLGGAVGTLFALRYPDKVDKLILVAPCPVDGLSTPPENLPFLELYKTNRTVVKKSILGLLKSIKNKRFIDQLVDDALKMNPKSVYVHADELGKFNIVHHAGANRVPTLVVFGDMDPLLTSAQMEKTARILNAKLLVLNGIGHTPFVENTEMFLRITEDFLGGV